jgi:hypothetical protein
MSTSIKYLVGAYAPVLAVIDDCIADMRAANIATQKFQEKYKASEALIRSDGWRFVGLVFKGSTPEGWRSSAECCVPDRRTRLGKAIAVEIDTLPKGVSGFDFSARLAHEFGQEFVYWGNGTVQWSTFGVYGDNVVFSVPAACNFKAEGCTELKTTEFLTLTEERV